MRLLNGWISSRCSYGKPAAQNRTKPAVRATQPLGRSHTGGYVPSNLNEQLAMEQVMSNPSGGKEINVPMTDPRWRAKEGWVKMAQNVNCERSKNRPSFTREARLMHDDHILFSTPNWEMTVEHLYTVEEYFTFRIHVKSNGFIGSSNFCMPHGAIVALIEACSNMIEDLKGQCELRDYDSDAHIILEINRLGQVHVSGQIGGTHEEHTLTFRNIMDQTAVLHLVHTFKALL